MEHIIQMILKEAGIKPVKKIVFEEWLKGKKFVDVDTKQPAFFYSLPLKQRLEIKKKYEIDEEERVKKELKDREEAEKAKKEEKEKEREKAKYPENKNYKWTDSRLQQRAKEWAKDSKSDLGEEFEGAVPDLAQNFLYQYPGVRLFLRSKGVKDQYHREYIADLMV
jgi:hypothetical protein